MQNKIFTAPLSPDRLGANKNGEEAGLVCQACLQTNRPQANFCRACGTALQSADATLVRLRPGLLLQGRYQVVRQIGEGGLGRVFLGTDSSGRRYVLKQIRQPANEDDAEHFGLYLQSFQREASILSSLPHPYLPIARDFIVTPNNFIIVLDYVEGRTLAELLDESPGPLPENQVLRWAIQVCDALIYLHNKKPPIIHRNLKPKNILLEMGENEHVRLTGFGLARYYVEGLQADEDNLGTQGYSPPEQYGSAQTDARSDIFGLGATMFALLSKRDPADFVECLDLDHIELKFPPLPELNPSVSPETSLAVQKALQVEREERFASAQEMKNALEAILNQAETLPEVEKYILGQEVPLEETLFCEFKEAKGSNPVQSIMNLVEQYVVAFLNSDGGRILWGIRDDDRCVTGVALTYQQRDQVRRGVLDKMMRVQPAVSPSAYRINFQTVYASAAAQKPEEDLYVVEILIPRPQTSLLYFTDSGEVYVKTEAGKKRLSGAEIQDEIIRRLQRTA